VGGSSWGNGPRSLRRQRFGASRVVQAVQVEWHSVSVHAATPAADLDATAGGQSAICRDGAPIGFVADRTGMGDINVGPLATTARAGHNYSDSNPTVSLILDMGLAATQARVVVLSLKTHPSVGSAVRRSFAPF